ncbi:MAG: signal peptidase II [Pseudomonadota bacterium]|nr:signal peptidase II [Pseudomonadota bacterium]
MSEAAPSFAARARDWLAAARANPRFRFAMLGAGAVLLLDQLSKYWIVHVVRLPERPGGRIEISGVFDLSYVENTGASFGMLAGQIFSRFLLSGVALAVSVWLVLWLGRLQRRWAATGAAFIIGGALGNMFDRARLGYVVDFFDFSGLYFPFVFNVADVCIDIGIGFLLLDAFLTRERAPKPPKT